MADLTWEAKLDDQMSAPASAMEARLEALENRLSELNKALGRTDKAQTKASKSIGMEASARAVAAKETRFQARSLGEWAIEAKEAAYANEGWLGTLSRTAGAVGSVAAPLVAAGAAIAGVGVAATAASARWLTNSLAFREDALVGMELLAGSAEEARRAFGQATRIGRMFGMADADSIRRVRDVIGSGFSGEEVDVVFTALADIDARGGKSAPFLEKLNEIRTVGKATLEDLKTLAKVSGVSLPAALDRISARLGTTRKGLVDIMSSPQGLDPDEGILGILTLLADASGGKLGRSAERGAQTFTKRIARIMQAPSGILNAIEFDRFEGFGSLNRMAAGLARELEPGTDSAKRLEGAFLAIDRVIGNVFTRWTGPNGAETMRSDLEGLTRQLERAAKAMETLSKPVGFALGAVSSAVSGPSPSAPVEQTIAGMILRASPGFGVGPIMNALDWLSGGDAPAPVAGQGKGDRAPQPVRHVGAPLSATAPSTVVGPTNNVSITVPITVNGAGSREAGEAIGELLVPDLHAAVLDTLEQLTTQVA